MEVLADRPSGRFRTGKTGVALARHTAEAMAEMFSPAPFNPHKPTVLPFASAGARMRSWIGSEERLRATRIHALLETVEAAVAAGDRATAESVLDEARTLSPNAPDIAAAAERVSRLSPPPPSTVAAVPWSRMVGAVALLLVGVSLLLGLDWLRTSPPAPPAPVSAVRSVGALKVPAAELVLATASSTAPRPVGRVARESRKQSRWGRVVGSTGRFLSTTLPKLLGDAMPDRRPLPRGTRATR